MTCLSVPKDTRQLHDSSLPPSGSGFWLVWHGWKRGINPTLVMHWLPFSHSEHESVQKCVCIQTITLDTHEEHVRSACRHTAPSDAGTSPKLLQRDALLFSPTLFLLYNKASLLPKEITAIIRFISTVSCHSATGSSKCQSAHWTIKVNGCS